MKKKSVIAITVISLAASTFGLEPSEMVRLHNAARTNEVVAKEYMELMGNHMDLFWDTYSRMNGVELLQMLGWMDVISSTPTNLVLKFRNPDYSVTHNGTSRRSGEYMANDEALILTPDQGARLGEYHITVIFNPVTLKKRGKGFQIIEHLDNPGKGLMSYTGYFALGNTLAPVDEEEVEGILEGGKWLTVKEYHANVERENQLRELRLERIVRRVEAEKLLQGEALTNRLAEIERETRLESERIVSGEPDEPSDEKPRASNRWLYALIPFGLLAVLYSLRKKRK